MLSIIIPVRNESNTMQDVFDYFFINLKNIDYEVIIVNDFSTDNTFEKANDLTTSYQNIKVFNNTKKGLGGAINLGIKKSTGENIAIIGNSGELSSGPHLHFELWKSGAPLDPSLYISF